MRKGVVIMNPVSIFDQKWSKGREVVWDINTPSVWGSRRIVGDVMACHWVEPQMPDWLRDDSALARDVTMTKAYAKLNEADVQSTVFAQELGKAVAMMRSPFKKALKHLGEYQKHVDRAMRKFRNSGLSQVEALQEIRARATLNAWRNAHLELNFGWKPIVMDINGAFKGLTRIAESKLNLPALRVSRDGWEHYYLGKGEVSVGRTPTGLQWGTASYQHTVQVRVNSGVAYVINEPSAAQSIQQAFGLGVSDIAPHVWEVLPYSWVFDYFVNVGDWLKSSILRPEIQIKGSWTTYLELWRCTSGLKAGITVVDPLDGSKIYPFEFQAEPINYESNRLERKVGIPRPSAPTIDPSSLSINRALNLAAISLSPFKSTRDTLSAMKVKH
jgi:hypothetical protein